MKNLIEYTKHSMISLIEYIEESLLDDFDDLSNKLDSTLIESATKWIKENFTVSNLKISNEYNSDGKFVVNAESVTIKNPNIKSLTNDKFVWGVVDDFDCSFCNVLPSLDGAPEKVKTYFDCSYCPGLTSLEGAPKEVGGDFDCCNCRSLKTFKGAPKEVGGNFECYGCQNIKDKRLPSYTKVRGVVNIV